MRGECQVMPELRLREGIELVVSGRAELDRLLLLGRESFYR